MGRIHTKLLHGIGNLESVLASPKRLLRTSTTNEVRTHSWWIPFRGPRGTSNPRPGKEFLQVKSVNGHRRPDLAVVGQEVALATPYLLLLPSSADYLARRHS